MATGALVVFGMIVIVTIGVIASLVYITKSNRSQAQFPHPSELSSESRSVVRPLRQAVENFELVIKANSKLEVATIIGGNALESARDTLREAMKLMPNRDVLVDMARRTESQGNDPSSPNDAIDRIDRNIAEATAAIDALTLKITSAATSQVSTLPEIESDLPDLVKRLQNVSQSFDEVNQSIDQQN